MESTKITGTSNGVLRVDDRQNNKISLNILTPPYLRRPLPQEVFGYLKTLRGQTYSVEITGIEKGDVLDITCFVECVSNSPKIALNLLDYQLNELAVSDFVAIETGKGNLYFKYVPNLQFRGMPLNIEVGQEKYLL